MSFGDLETLLLLQYYIQRCNALMDYDPAQLTVLYCDDLATLWPKVHGLYLPTFWNFHEEN